MSNEHNLEAHCIYMRIYCPELWIDYDVCVCMKSTYECIDNY